MNASSQATLPGEGRGRTPREGGHKPWAVTLPIDVGSRVDRYVVVERLGRGAMGVVVSAYDPKLDRRIALKVLRPLGGSVADSDTAGAAARLIREARALAKVAHPNVVAVYDADAIEGHVFIAMEYVDGRSLKEWLAERERSWSEVVDVFRQAGEGLAAAHGVEIVHRDFKPDNVLVGDDGRVRVVDFGIARPLQAGGSPPSASSSGRMDAIGDADLTRTGAIVGTPAYMSPEQHVGLTSDARSDQFSFCVSLYEALFGKRPFTGDSLAALALNVTEGNVAELPTDSKVPAPLRALVLRGLSADPGERFPDMRALLDALSVDRGRHRRRLVAGLAAVVLVATGAGIVAAARTGADVCAGAERHFAGVWDGQVRDAAEAAFESTNLPYADRAWSHAAEALDRYTEAWADARRERCEATHVHGEQSPALLDRAMACLDARLRRVEALTPLLAEADRDVVENAVDAVDALPEIEACVDAEALLADEHAAADPELDAMLANVAMLRVSGKLEAALEAAEAGLERAEPDSAAQAKLLRQRGVLLEGAGRFADAESTLFEAVRAADRSGADLVRAAAAGELAFVVATRGGRPAEAQRWVEIAEAVAGRTTAHPARAAQLMTVRAAIFHREGKLREAAAIYDLAVAAYRDLPGAVPELADVLHSAGTVLTALGEPQRALDLQREGLALLEDRHGPSHPSVAGALDAIGVNLRVLGHRQDALDTYERALAIKRVTLSPDNPAVAMTLINMGVALAEEGRYAEAADRYEEALEVNERALGAEHVNVGMTLYNLGVNLQLNGNFAAALPRYRRSLSIYEAGYGPNHLSVAYPLAGLGTALVGLKRFDEARPHLERALAIRAAHDDATDRGELQFALAQALFEHEHQRARELASAGMADYRAAGDEATAAQIEAWLERTRG